MSIPTQYPVTMVDPKTGNEYDVHNPGEFVTAFYEMAHVVKPASAAPAATVAPAVAVPASPAVAPPATAAPVTVAAPTKAG